LPPIPVLIHVKAPRDTGSDPGVCPALHDQPFRRIIGVPPPGESGRVVYVGTLIESEFQQTNNSESDPAVRAPANQPLATGRPPGGGAPESIRQ